MFTRVALTGGIGAGKSTIATYLASKGAFIIDYDELSSAAVAKGSEGLRRVVDLFGPEALTIDGTMNRHWVSEQIFSHPDLRRKLDDIIHPLVFAEAGRRETAWLAAHPSVSAEDRRIAIHDIPLLVESGRADWFDVILDVEAPARVRMHRLVEQRGMSMEEAASRIDAQSSEEERKALATAVINSNQPLEQTLRQVDTVFNQVLKR